MVLSLVGPHPLACGLHCLYYIQSTAKELSLSDLLLRDDMDTSSLYQSTSHVAYEGGRMVELLPLEILGRSRSTFTFSRL